MLVLLHCCCPTRQKNQNKYPLVYSTYISCLDLVTPTLVIPLSFKSYMLGHVRLIYDASIDGEHQEEQPGRRGTATTTPSLHGAADDDADPVASAVAQNM